VTLSPQHARLPLLGMIFLVFGAVLASCATPPRAMTRSVIVSVVSVDVSSDFGVDPTFTSPLYKSLASSVGRATGDIGRDANLRIFVRSLQRGFAGIGGMTVAYDVVLTSVEDGRIIYSGLGRQNGPDTYALIAGITADTRRLLGLEGSVPVAVDAVRKPVIRPVARPVFDVDPTPPPVSADPLLNGTVTPAYEASDADAADPVIDTSRPLLTPDTPAPKSLARDAMADEAQDGDIITGNEPCVITVANDCTVVDAAQ
jgi:hypothetical protein